MFLIPQFLKKLELVPLRNFDPI